MNATQAFARDCGYAGQSPAMLAAFEAVRRSGIVEARAAHFARKRVTDAITADPDLIAAMIHPAQSIDEALQDIAAFILRTRNMPTWRRHNHAAAIARAKARRLHLRFFRRFATAILARKAA
ncbi:hypothetical protein HNQ96_005394 [Aminobacter lissarensis]|uniref:Uncharacterized protein n=1 Tax=Aminobacter carboxidus TaxID=376165 RepID=A0A8E1WKV5_9HYPH|nr:hypothetical protein [Aminobacter lissarensis]MBB6469504.1 hypothetical protein [Aminobacter lissarensis]